MILIKTKRKKKQALLVKRPAKELFLGIGVSFTTAVFVVGLFILVIWGAYIVRQLLEKEFWERASRAVEEAAQSIGADRSDRTDRTDSSGVPYGPLVFASFSDLFSGTGWLDTERTTMYLDLSASAFTFSPKVSWEKVSGSGESAASGARCIGARCLEVRGTQVFLDGKTMTLPASVEEAMIVNVSVEALDTRWALGFVTKENGEYRGSVFTFDGTRFTSVFSGERALTSSYLGTLGFGGGDNDWLVLYGAYEGIAYHVREGAAPRNISSFFHARLMNNGFAPRILRIGNCKLEIGNCFPTWFIWSEARGAPRFLKLFQNGTAEIQGVIDLASTFPARGVTALSLRPGDTSYELLITLSFNSAPEEWRFTDYGFDIAEERAIVSKNLNTYRAEVPQLVRLDVGVSSFTGSEVQFLVSNDGESWHATALGEALVFPNPNGTKLFWKAVVGSGSDLFLSPFIERVNLDYKVRYIR